MTLLKKAILAIALLSSVGLTACNTFAGFGQDVQRGGRNIEREANEHR